MLHSFLANFFNQKSPTQKAPPTYWAAEHPLNFFPRPIMNLLMFFLDKNL